MKTVYRCRYWAVAYLVRGLEKVSIAVELLSDWLWHLAPSEDKYHPIRQAARE